MGIQKFHTNHFHIRASGRLGGLNRPSLCKEEVIAKYSSPAKNLESIFLLEHRLTITNSQNPESLKVHIAVKDIPVFTCRVSFFLWASGNGHI